jgi:hypothetical protein
MNNKQDLLNSIIENERKIKGLLPHYPEQHGNRDRTGKLLTNEEIEQLKRIREKLIPKNVVLAAIPKNVLEPKKRRGRPVVEGSLRQQKLASPIVPKKRGRPPKKVIIEETKEETKQEETKEDLAPKKRRGRPVVEGSKRQQKLAVVEPKKRGRPVGQQNKPSLKKVGRPSKCSSVMPKNNEPTKNIFSKPIIEWIDIDKKYKLTSTQNVNPLLLKYSKMNISLFFDIMNTLTKQRLASRIKGDIKKNPTKNDLFIIYRKICDFAIFYGFTTAYEIEQSLITRIVGDLQDKPKELKRFLSFLKKNCVGKQSSEPIKKISKEQNDKNKVYPLQKLTVFYEVPLEGKILKDNSIDEIFRDAYVGKNASIRMNNDKIEVVDYEYDEEGNATTNKEWKTIKLKKSLLKGLVKRIIDAVKEVVDEETYKLFIKDYNEDPQSVFDLILERIPEL